ncbi:uncharacterized protein [Haliotis cracherodii]|uniref:uncharacterized protein n=1 Tax=Haliotis cracherodii TaxID=6455 RepID=UPI0039E9AB71
METMCTIAFFGFLRCGEFTCSSSFDVEANICVEDITFDSRCILRLEVSKTDPFRHFISLFATKNLVCPFRSLTQLVWIRRQSGARNTDPLFVDSSFTAITRNTLRWLSIILCRAGFSSSGYSGHSFRIGAATTAAQARLEDHLIKTLGWWSSDCFTRYIPTPKATLRQAQISLCTV